MFRQLVSDPRLVWHEPPGLTGPVKASVDALHDYFLHYLKFEATLKLNASGVLEDFKPPLRTAQLSQLSRYTIKATGTLVVTVTSAKLAGASVFLQDCYDQVNLHDVGKNGQPVIVHDANDHLTEYWTFSKTGARWYGTFGASRQACT